MAKPNGKTALVTGSTDGVGRMVATRLGEGGWRVLVHGRDRTRGEEVVGKIKAAGGAAEFLQGGPLGLGRSAPPRANGRARDRPARSPPQ